MTRIDRRPAVMQIVAQHCLLMLLASKLRHDSYCSSSCYPYGLSTSSASSSSSPPSCAMTPIARHPAVHADRRRALPAHATRLYTTPLPRRPAVMQIVAELCLLKLSTSNQRHNFYRSSSCCPYRSSPSKAYSCSMPPSLATTRIPRRPAVHADRRPALPVLATRLQAAP
jgi:hypothetical protein